MSNAPASPPLVSPAGERLVPFGELVGTHGVRGELRMRSFNPGSEVLHELRTVYLAPPAGPLRLVTIEGARPHQAVWLLRIAGVATMDEARSLLRSRLAAREADLPRLGEREYYHYQLVGLAAADENGGSLGRVSSILSAAGNDVLVLTDETGRERMVPMVEEVVRSVDPAAGRIVIRPLPGLFED